MCMMCMILSPNCCTVTIVEYSSTDVTLLRSCLSVLSEHVASQSKWQSADLDFLKLAKKRKSVGSALFRGINVCIWSDKISNVIAILGRKSTARLKVNQTTRSLTCDQACFFFFFGKKGKKIRLIHLFNQPLTAPNLNKLRCGRTVTLWANQHSPEVKQLLFSLRANPRLRYKQVLLFLR